MAKVLIVDDDPGTRDVLKQFLEYNGHEVSLARDGQEGIDVQRQKSARVIITDISMPRKNGIELILELKPEYPNTKFIAISGGGSCQSGEEILVEAKNAGADFTFQKPISGCLLTASVSALLMEDDTNDFEKRINRT